MDNMNIGILLVMIVGGAAGILSTAFLVISLPATIVWKIYRKIAKGIPSPCKLYFCLPEPLKAPARFLSGMQSSFHP